jgi:hypothetical protein
MHKVLLNRLNILHRKATLAIGFANKAQYRMHKLLLNILNVLQQANVNLDHIVTRMDDDEVKAML